MARTSATSELSPSLIAVNSIGDTVPSSWLSSRKSSTAPMRSVEMHRARKNGVTRFSRIGMNGASSVCTARAPIIIEPTAQRRAATYSMTPKRSLFRIRARSTVQRRSLDWSSRCIPVSTSCRPQFVTPYFSPKSRPTGATCLILYLKCGPRSQESPLPDEEPAEGQQKWPATFTQARTTATKPSCRNAVATGYGNLVRSPTPLEKTSLLKMGTADTARQ
mmetsp:Transcript_67108/g.196963  ORF Transcript_67108/g.196963 Transcript_67108/m.196963 type:complete len:220 (-) Transcript_67108:163-822(-)